MVSGLFKPIGASGTLTLVQQGFCSCLPLRESACTPGSRWLAATQLPGAALQASAGSWDHQGLSVGCESYRVLRSCLRVVVGQLKWGFTVLFVKEKCIWKGLNGGRFVPAMRAPAGAGLCHRELKNGAGRRRNLFEGSSASSHPLQGWRAHTSRACVVPRVALLAWHLACFPGSWEGSRAPLQGRERLVRAPSDLE